MKGRHYLLAGSIALILGSGGYLGYGMYKDKGLNEARERTVAALAVSYKACPDRFNAHRSCHTREERDKMLTEAEKARSEGRWEDAANKFVELGRENDAREMAGRCGKATRERIIGELNLRRDAAERVLHPERRK